MTHLRGIKPALAPDREPLTKVPPVPKHLSTHAREEWRRILPRLIEDRIITRADLGGIEDLCIARGYVREIEAMRRQAGGPPDKVLFGMLNRAMQTARQLAAEYGLSPTSRARVASGAADDDDDNPLAVT
ncbi:P27 family phage terminase small subunit [Defluviimonas sp. D31]|uniref:P27 family phage terminase small subunit n=1 Tax=Defluviimonas sp. D31 TaxID=3083253 RepID=UPI00296E38E3|nr:P27 family phage terminase small subunit [Defluviimonas sp. D31]MDW4548839.1 P27 family phage terminase small subunit [Defluviimonas sp. D31]